MTRAAQISMGVAEPVRETDSRGTTTWKIDGVLHREDGPAVEYANGAKFWYRHGQYHREDGPAVEYANGAKFWHRHGQCHREDGPAAEWSDGTKEWFRHGQRHRDDGPAIETADGTKEWWLNGEQCTTPEWLREVLEGRPLTVQQRELLFALSENWVGTPDLLYETTRNLSPRCPDTREVGE